MISIANVGQTDKIIRILADIALIAASFLALGGLATTIGLVALVVSAVLIVTGLFNFCPAYKILGIGSLKKQRNQSVKAR